MGDYKLKEQPVSLIDRFFWRDDGTVLGICSIADAIRRIKAPSLISWLADGVCVQTTSLEDPHPDQQPDPDATACRSRTHRICQSPIFARDTYSK